MLAGIEDQEEPPVPQIGDEAGCRIVRLHRQSELRGNSCGHQPGVAQRTEVDEKNGAHEISHQMMADGYSDSRLSDAARPDD